MPLSLALFRWFFFRSLFQVFKSLIFLTTSTNPHHWCYIIVITWALVVCLICTPSALGPAALGPRVYISGKPLMPMLQLLNVACCCITRSKHLVFFKITFKKNTYAHECAYALLCTCVYACPALYLVASYMAPVIDVVDGHGFSDSELAIRLY